MDRGEKDTGTRRGERDNRRGDRDNRRGERDSRRGDRGPDRGDRDSRRSGRDSNRRDNRGRNRDNANPRRRNERSRDCSPIPSLARPKTFCKKERCTDYSCKERSIHMSFREKEHYEETGEFKPELWDVIRERFLAGKIPYPSMFKVCRDYINNKCSKTRCPREHLSSWDFNSRLAILVKDDLNAVTIEDEVEIIKKKAQNLAKENEKLKAETAKYIYDDVEKENLEKTLAENKILMEETKGFEESLKNMEEEKGPLWKQIEMMMKWELLNDGLEEKLHNCEKERLFLQESIDEANRNVLLLQNAVDPDVQRKLDDIEILKQERDQLVKDNEKLSQQIKSAGSRY